MKTFVVGGSHGEVEYDLDTGLPVDKPYDGITKIDIEATKETLSQVDWGDLEEGAWIDTLLVSGWTKKGYFGPESGFIQHLLGETA